MVETAMEKFLIFGGTGYIGNLMVKASLKLGHPTYVFSRPTSTKTDLLHDFQSLGAIIVKGELDEHEKLVSVMKEVDVVISAVAFPQVLDQFKILEAIKVAGNIKRFLPSDFGVEEDRVSVLPAFDALLEKKKKIRRAIEEANIPYTFISPNCCASHFIDFLPRPSDPNHDIIVYGSGEAQFVMNYEQDIGIYTIKVATDPRTCNRVVIYKPSTNVLTQLELISKWEAKIGRNFKKIHFPEEEMVALSQRLPEPQNVPMAILHSILIKGVTANYDLGENDVEASTLYPDLKFATVDEIVDIFLHNPAKPPNEVFG